MAQLILLADDSAGIRSALTDILEARGYEVAVAADAGELVEKARSRRPDLIIADMMMPGGYGSAAYKTLQNNPATTKVPAIFITAMAEEQARPLVPETPNVRLLFKPVDVAELLQMIADLLAPPTKSP